MDGDADGFRDGLKACFADLRDPRIAKSCDHLLIDILSMAALAVACGADEWTGMETFASCGTTGSRRSCNPGWRAFARHVSASVRVARPEAVRDLPLSLDQAIHEAGRQTDCHDGKTLRRSFAKKTGLKALHLVTAWATRTA